MKRGFALFIENKRKNTNNKEKLLLQFNYGKIVPKSIQDAETDNIEIYSKYTIVNPGQIMINGLNLNYDFVSQRVAICDYNGIITSAYISLVCRNNSQSQYLKYLLKAFDSIKMFHGLGSGVRQTLTASGVMRMQFPVPPIEEQNQIVHFLDWKISEINHFIKEKKKEIKIFEEYKINKINNLLTKGLNEKVSMISSNVDWIGEIPAHWSIGMIKQHFSVKKRIAGKEGYDVLSITQRGLKIKDITTNEGQMAQSYANYQFVYPGDFAMNNMDLITGYVDLSKYFGVTSPDFRVFVLDDTENCYAPYYLRVFQIGYKRRVFYKFGKGAANQGRWRLPKQAFLNYQIPVPSYDEQVAIADMCERIDQEIGDFIEKLQKEIVLVEELSNKIISDAVTGKIDVRGVKIPEYQFEVDELDIETEDEENTD
jgi:type I restriction enzyme S subunit